MATCYRYRPSSCWYWLLVILGVVALLGFLHLDGDPWSSGRLVRDAGATAASYNWETSRSFSSSRAYSSVSAGAIFKGQPKTPFPTPKSPVPLSQPTLSHPTMQTKNRLLFSHKALKSTEEVLGSAWVLRLRELIGKIHLRKQVTIVFSNSDYMESLLNWLIAARVQLSPPLANMLIVCLDVDVCRILHRRNISSLHIDPTTVVNSTHLEGKEYRYTVWMVRYVVFRMINYWGYDFVAYDTDALIVKNPQELFDRHRSSDIVGSAGKFPHALGRQWGFTICMGVILFRSSPRTG